MRDDYRIGINCCMRPTVANVRVQSLLLVMTIPKLHLPEWTHNRLQAEIVRSDSWNCEKRFHSCRDHQNSCTYRSTGRSSVNNGDFPRCIVKMHIYFEDQLTSNMFVSFDFLSLSGFTSAFRWSEKQQTIMKCKKCRYCSSTWRGWLPFY